MDVLVFLLSFVIILVGCEFFTNAVEWIGKKYHLSEGAVGSVLAAVGTALPETMIPIITILFAPTDGSSEEIGVGAILGAPFMLTTLALFICGLAVIIFAKRRKTKSLKVHKTLVQRDLRIFLIAYSFAALAAFLPPDMDWARWIIGLSLIPLYMFYVKRTLKTGDTCADDEVDPLYCDTIADKCFGRTGEEIPCLPDPVARGIDKLRAHEPSTGLIFFQFFAALAMIILGAYLFVEQIEMLATDLGISALVLSIIIVPIATELPEKFNSILWIREGKDTFAIGNITGAMVFQSCIPVALGVLLTDWYIDLNIPEQLLSALTIGIAIFSASVLYLESKKDEVKVWGLLLGGALYAIFIAAVFLLI
jgi:cation:H+ antiporter